MTEKRATPLRAAYVAYVSGTENYGDETLHTILRDMLAPEIKLVGMTDEADIALLGGGTLINQSPWLIDTFAAALDRAGQGAVLGTGVGDPVFWGNNFDRWTRLLKRCRWVGVRGPRSVRLLENHGFLSAHLVGDPYLTLDGPPIQQPIPGRITVNCGSTNDSLWGTTDQDLIGMLTQVCRRLKEEGCKFSWVSVWSKDIALLEELRQRVDPQSPPVIDARTQTEEALATVASSEIFIGEKLHANAMAAIADVPFLALEYQPKVADFAESLNMQDYCIPTDERDVDHVLNVIARMRGHRAALSLEIHTARERLKRAFTQHTERLKVGIRAAMLKERIPSRPGDAR